MQIEVDFEVFKELTARRTHEGHTYNEVIREALGLGPTLNQSMGMASVGHALVKVFTGSQPREGLSLRGGVFLPEGTEIRASYKGNLYTAEIRNERWIDQEGREHSSPSAAAHHITQTNVNGWRFWEAKRPGESQWRKLDALS